MKLSTRGRYGTRIMLEIALNPAREPILLKDIAQRQQISLTYLEHLIKPLVAAGLVRSSRGPRGGISLAKPADEIRLSEVLQLLEGSMAPVDCVNDPAACSRAALCVTRDVWGELKGVIDGYLESVTLQNLLERHKEKKNVGMYYI
jgi:Rrf2 family transcriptional regulator, cysteine metabolism repressor